MSENLRLILDLSMIPTVARSLTATFQERSKISYLLHLIGSSCHLLRAPGWGMVLVETLANAKIRRHKEEKEPMKVKDYQCGLPT